VFRIGERFVKIAVILNGVDFASFITLIFGIRHCSSQIASFIQHINYINATYDRQLQAGIKSK
jgi:hypothetical protein